MDRLDGVIAELREFVRAREWEQFHDPKNLAMAVVSEAGELAAEYRWVTNDEADSWSRDPANLERVADEVADIGIALLLFSDRVGIDLVQSLQGKIAKNRKNYPVAASRGKAERPWPYKENGTDG